MDFRIIFEFLICIFYSSCQTSIVNEGAFTTCIERITLFLEAYSLEGATGSQSLPGYVNFQGLFGAEPPPSEQQQIPEDARP